MAAPTYRFLPWTSRGLAAALPAPTATPPQRGRIDLAITVSGVAPVTASATLQGPGDVLGIDPAQVVRVTPARHTTDAEPNYLAAIDFDAPELPWLFTPHGAPPDQRLMPWIVLVVVEERAGVDLQQQPGWPLPRLRMASGAQSELPDLAQAWAWAHAQLLDPGSGGNAALAAALAADPDRNVSRLICPRRLAPGKRWIAAVVPAYGVGVIRGLGGEPAAGSPLSPAWTDEDAVTLPVYYHWRFQTGPEGDFESLARRLMPHQAATTVGAAPMFVGDGGPAIRVPPDQAQVLAMDGALRAPVQQNGTLAEVPPALVAGLAEVTRVSADAANGVLDGAAPSDGSSQPVGPPVYASAHVRRWRVRPDDALWFRELNTDPRPRAACWLGGEIVRRNQEDIMAAAWSQVGDVLAAEAALQRAALTRWAASAFFRRSIAVLSDDRLLTLAAPLAAVTPFGGAALAAAIHQTSLPDGVLDAGLRRTLAPSGRAVQAAAHRAGIAAAQVRTGLVATLAAGTGAVDATRFDRPALSGLPTATSPGEVIAALGLPITLPVERTAGLLESARAIAATPPPGLDERLAPRADLRSTGVPGQAHLDAARRLTTMTAHDVAEAESPTADALLATAVGDTMDQILASLAASPAAGDPGVGLLMTAPRVDPRTGATERPTVEMLDLDRRGSLVVRTPGPARNVPIATVEPTATPADVAALLAHLPEGTLARPGRAVDPAELPRIARRGAAPSTPGTQPRIERPGEGRGRPPAVTPPAVTPPAVTPPASPAPVARTVTAPPLLREPAALARLESALALQASATALRLAAPTATAVPFDLHASMQVVRQRTDPAVVQPLRRDALITLAGRGVGAWGRTPGHAVDGWWATRAIDRVMAYPTFDAAAYAALASYDRTRLCPGVEEVPAESITLLETNPRFIAGFMAGLNHETNRELLWRGYPTDSRGTPFRRFWDRLDGRPDIAPIHSWRTGGLAQQAGGTSNLVLLLRGDLLRRYPGTAVVAVRALSKTAPSRDPDDIRTPIFAGRFDPDLSFFGFDLIDTDLSTGQGWFFALMEPMTEPRFGLDETDTPGSPSTWQAVGWGDTAVPPGGYLPVTALERLPITPGVAGADGVAQAMFQHPFALYVHADHLLSR